MDVKKYEKVLRLARQFGPTFGFFGYCGTEYLTLRSACAISDPYLLRRLMPFTACSRNQSDHELFDVSSKTIETFVGL